MGKDALVDKHIDAGRKLLEALDEAGFQVKAALWLYKTEAEEWKLVLASRLADSKGVKYAYRRIDAILEKSGTISAINPLAVSIAESNDALIGALRNRFRKYAKSEFRLSQAAVNGAFVEDAYIYRL